MRVTQKILAVCSVLSLVLSFAWYLTPQAYAGFLTQRRVEVKTPIASSVTDYTVSFNIATADTLGSIQLQFCDDTPFIGTSCAVPPGFVMNTSSLTSQTGETGFTISASSTSNNIILTRTPTSSLPGPVTYVFTGVTNPSTPNYSVYMRISTYQTVNASGPRTDQGAAVFSTSGKFGTAAFVPPYLYFCVGVTVAPDCSLTTDSSVSFGEFTPSAPRSISTQFAAATNDTTGYNIFALGSTLTSGNNEITPMSIANPSIAGVSQFGLNLRDNSNPNIGQNMTGAGNGAPAADYNAPNMYKFEPGAAVASATQPTDYNVYTASYVGNIPVNQPAGVYATTITYMAVAQF